MDDSGLVRLHNHGVWTQVNRIAAAHSGQLAVLPPSKRRWTALIFAAGGSLGSRQEDIKANVLELSKWWPCCRGGATIAVSSIAANDYE